MNVPYALLKPSSKSVAFSLHAKIIHVKCTGAYLSAQKAVDGDDNEALDRVENGKKDLEEDGAPVSHGEHS